MTDLLYRCQKVNTPLVDIPRQWEAYIPDAAKPQSPPINTTSPLPLQSSTVQPFHLSDGAIAGLSVGVVVALTLFLALSLKFWRTKKKAADLTKKNAILIDERSEHGVASYIRGLWDKSTVSLNATDNNTTLVGSPVLVPPQLQRQYSESVYEDEIRPVQREAQDHHADEPHREGKQRTSAGRYYE